MYFVYIIYSKKRDSFYIEYTANINTRIIKHNAGATISTKSGIPWELVYSEQYVTKTEAIKREKAIKKKKQEIY